MFMFKGFKIIFQKTLIVDFKPVEFCSQMGSLSEKRRGCEAPCSANCRMI
jgi:hypothetical protein